MLKKIPPIQLLYALSLILAGCGIDKEINHTGPAMKHKTSDAHLGLWENEAQNIAWFKRWEKPLVWNEPFAHWFAGGELNASYAALDAHLKNNAEKKAIIWQSENGETRTLTYRELFDEVNRLAFVLKNMGVSKGDIVTLYLPMIPQAIAAMLAVTRLGATHSVVFSGFSSIALKDRIQDTKSRFVITADYGLRRGKKIELKKIVDDALRSETTVKTVLVINRDSDFASITPRDIVYSKVRPKTQVAVDAVPVESNHPLFILYTSGTTGKPKGIMHSTGGYLTYVYSTFKNAFNPQPNSVYWCTADIGWITGHSYVTYAPLLHGITSFIFEGAPDYPDSGVWWKMIQDNNISIFYTSPTAIRMAIKAGDEWPNKYDLSSLKVLGTVGEPINPDVWEWFFSVIGKKNIPVIDTWWQTETGGFMIAPRASQALTELKPGSATKPLPGIEAQVVDADGIEVSANTKGFLVITKPWPGMTIGIYGDPERFKEIYWSKFPHCYYPGDYAIQDTEGYFWLLGRADEVLNISGHRIGTAEIESAALTHPAVAEAATIGINDEIRGEMPVLFITLKRGYEQSEALIKEINGAIRTDIGAFVVPREIYFVQKLPKTRSGKIMRRVLKGILEGRSLGDVTTLEDEASVEEIQTQYTALKNIVNINNP